MEKRGAAPASSNSTGSTSGSGGVAAATKAPKGSDVVPAPLTAEALAHPQSTAHGFRDTWLGEWRLLYHICYREEDSQEECTCWQRLQCAHSIARYKNAMASPFTKGILGVKITEFGIPLTFAGNAMLWQQLQSVNIKWMMSSFPDGFGNIMQQVSWWIGAVVQAVLMLLMLVKLFTCRHAVMIEAIFHQRNSFLFTPQLVLIVLILTFPYSMHTYESFLVSFWIAFVLQVIGALVVYRQWMFDKFRSLQSTPPSFLMGTVGWLFCAMLAHQAGQLGFGWFCFSVGILFYTMVLILMMQGLPAIISTDGMRWTVFLNVAPPSLCASFIAMLSVPEGAIAHDSLASLLPCYLTQLFFVYIALFMAVLFHIEFICNYFPKRYQMELWASAFPTTALAAALMQATVLPGMALQSELTTTLQAPRWLAITVVCWALLLTLLLSCWLLVALWRREPKFQLNDPLLHEMHMNLQRCMRKQCQYCRCRIELGLVAGSNYAGLP